jgi:hypothetical protein
MHDNDESRACGWHNGAGQDAQRHRQGLEFVAVCPHLPANRYGAEIQRRPYALYG